MITNLEDLKQRVNIVEIIESYLPLRKEGVNFKALCPFHSEKTPSFVVNPNKNMFYCFGCGESGDSFSFVSKYKKLDFAASVEEVAQLTGFVLEYEKGVYQKDLSPILDFANAIFKAELKAMFETLGIDDNSLDQEPKEVWQSQPPLKAEGFLGDFGGYEARGEGSYLSGSEQAECAHSHKIVKKPTQIAKWLVNRGVSLDICDKYDIGFCSPAALEKIKAQFPSSELHNAGLLNNNKCFLFDRITLAIRNDAHKIRGFSGRTHPYSNFKNSAKYINSRENALFKKSFLLYAGSLAKGEIAKKEQIIVCEGFFDVIAFHKFGYKNAICTIGTAFNKAHLAHIFKLKSDCEIVFAFDNDSAGQEANLRALRVCFENGYFHTSVVALDEEGKDLGDYLSADSPPKMKKINGFKYYCDRALAKASNDIDKDRIYKDLTAIAHSAPPFTQSTLLNTLARFAPKGVVPHLPLKDPSQEQAQALNLNPYHLEHSILATMLENAEFCAIAREFLSKEDFSNQKAFESVFANDYKALGFLSNARILRESEWSESLECFKKQGLKRSLQSAQKRGDVEMMIALRAKIHELERLNF